MLYTRVTWCVITHQVVRTIAEYFQIGQRLYPVERGPRSQTPIQSSRFLSYRFHRPLEISSVKRNAQNRHGEKRGRTSDVAGNYGGNSRRRTAEERENKTSAFYKRFWNCVRLGHETRRRGQREGRRKRQDRKGRRKSKLGVGIYRTLWRARGRERDGSYFSSMKN